MLNVFDEYNNRVEGMSKEQILAAIVEAVETHEISDVDTGFVTTLKESNKNTALKFWCGTQAQYNAIAAKETNCFYIITDEEDIIDAMYEEVQILKEKASLQGVELYRGDIEGDHYGDLSVPVANLEKYKLVNVLISGTVQDSSAMGVCAVYVSGTSFSVRGIVPKNMDYPTAQYGVVNISGSIIDGVAVVKSNVSFVGDTSVKASVKVITGVI